MKNKSTATLIRAYLKRRSNPATVSDIVRSVSNKTSVKSETIRRTVYRLVKSGLVFSAVPKGTNANRAGFKLVQPA